VDPRNEITEVSAGHDKFAQLILSHRDSGHGVKPSESPGPGAAGHAGILATGRRWTEILDRDQALLHECSLPDLAAGLRSPADGAG
jgi:hypothetical protein